MEHLHYLQRDGVGIDGREPKIFDRENELDRHKVEEWGQEISQDRHHFRLIVSPERAADLDLRRYTRELVTQMERDLHTELDWIAVSHYNTDNPHVHIVLRGVDERGKDLVLSRDYISRGIRINGQEIATRELGLRSELELQQEVKRSLMQERFTGIDRKLERQAKEHAQGLIDLRQPQPKGCDFARRQHLNKLERLCYLESLGLAEEAGVGRWRLAADMPERLRELGVRHDIIKTMHAMGKQVDLSSSFVIVDRQHPPAEHLTGKMLHWGYADELSDSKCLTIEAKDGGIYNIQLDQDAEEPYGGYKVGETVRVRVVEQGLGSRIKLDRISRSMDLGLELAIPLQTYKQMEEE